MMWAIFGIGVLTVAMIPLAWGTINHTAATGVKSNANMAQALWGHSPPVSQYVADWANNDQVPIIPGAVEGVIQHVEWDTSSFVPKLTLTGYGFGNPPASGQSTLSILDTSRGWLASNGPSTSVQAVVQSWTNEKIVISGFTNYGGADTSDWGDGLGSWVFAPGDTITIQVTNPQTHNTGSMTGQFPQNVPLSTISLHTIGNIVAQATTNITGCVTFLGKPLANQAVSLSVTGGVIQGTEVMNEPGEFVVYTDANGDFSIPYTASSSGQTVTLNASADGVTATQVFSVLAPKLTLQVDVPGSGATASTGYVVQGQLTSNGQPIAGQTVTLSATGGVVSPSTVTTDGNGDFHSTYTTPASPGSYTLTATSLGTEATVGVTVANLLANGPITAGMPALWSGNWASHMYLTNLPQGTQILATNGFAPTAVYFKYGSGQVFADTQTVEYYYNSAAWATTEWNNIIHNYLEPSKKSVLLLCDGTYWGQNQTAVNAIRSLVSATVSSLSQASIPNINQYGVIVVDAVQASYFASNLQQVMPELNQWIQKGGTLIFDSTDQGNSGISWSVGPDGISNVWDLAPENYLVADVHP